MEEIYDGRDYNRLFHTAKTMHDNRILHIDVSDSSITLTFELDAPEYYGGYSRVRVEYILDEAEDGWVVDLIKRNRHDIRSRDKTVIDRLNQCIMFMYGFSVDDTGMFTLHFDAHTGKRFRAVELCFTPKTVKYIWEK